MPSPLLTDLQTRVGGTHWRAQRPLRQCRELAARLFASNPLQGRVPGRPLPSAIPQGLRSHPFPGTVITYVQMERLEGPAVSSTKWAKIRKATTKEAVYSPVVLAIGGYAADTTAESLLKKPRPE